MTKKTNSFKNIITVLLALLLIGIDAGLASAAADITIDNARITSSNTVVVTFDDHDGELGDGLLDQTKWHIDVGDGGLTPLNPSGGALTQTISPYIITLTFAGAPFSSNSISYNASWGLYVDANGLIDETESFSNAVVLNSDSIAIGSSACPVVTSAKYISDTELKIYFDRTLDIASTVDETKITITNNAGTAIAVTDNSAVVTGNILTITTASVGSTAFKIDNATQGLDLAVGAVSDSSSFDKNGVFLNITVADGQKPTFNAARTALNTIVLSFSEPVTGSAIANSFTVAGASSVTNTAPTASTTITLTTVGLTATNGTPAVNYVSTTGNIADNAGTPNEIADGGAIAAADKVRPTVTSATLNYDTGVLVVTFSETIDASATVPPDFHLNDVTGTDVVNLSASPADVDATTLTFTLTEPQRIAALAISGVNGGNGDAVVLDVDAGGVTDMASNTNLVDDASTVTESSTPAATLATISLSSSAYVSGGTATVSVNDPDMNTLSGSNQTLTVNLTSTTNSTNLTLILTETGVNTGIFNGTFTFNSIGGALQLVVSDGDTIYAKYTDNDSVLRFTDATFNAVANKLVINSTTYGNLTDMNGAAVTPSSMVAGVATVFKINATDANGVLDTGFNGTMTISVNGSGTLNLTSYPFVAVNNGTKSISVTDNVAETIVINFNSTSVTTNATTTQAVVPNKPYKLLFNSSMPLGTLTNSLQVNISVADAYNNLINASKLTGNSFPTNATQLGGTDGLGLGIKFNLSLSLPTPPLASAYLNTTSVVITNANVNNYVAYVNDTVDETVTLKATAVFFSPAYITTNLSFLWAVSNLLVSTNKISNTANANGGANSLGSIIITAQLRDASGNALSVPGSVITFNSDNPTILNVVGQTATTNANGIAIITVSTTTVAGTAVITAQDTTGHEGTVTVTTTAIVDNANSELVVNPAAKAGDNVTVYATLYDYAGTEMPAGTTVSFSITSGDPTSTLNSVAKGTIVTADTNSEGVATVTFRGTNASGAHSISATVVDEQGDIKQVGTSEQTITVSPNVAAVLVVLPASKGLENIKGTNVTFNVTVYDAYNNVNTTGEILVNVSTTDTTLGNMTVGSTVVNNHAVITTSSGIGSMLYKINSTTAGTATLTFAAYKNETGNSGLSTNFTASVHVTTKGATGIALTFDGSVQDIGSYVLASAQLTDSSGLALSISGTSISFVVRNAAGVTQLVNTSATNDTGIATFSFNRTIAGVYTLTASNATLGLSNSTTVTFVGSAASIVVTANKTSPLVNATVTINATVKDSSGITSRSLGNGTITFLANDIGFASATLSEGVARTTYTKATAGAVTITAFYNATLQNTTTVTFTPAVLPALVSSITPNSRNAQLSTPVTLFMSVINYGTGTATGVSIIQASSLAATVSYQQWDGTSLIGSANTPVNMAAGATANFVLTINATSAFDSSPMTFNVSSSNGATASINGVNTLTMSANATPSADIIMMSTNVNVSTPVNNATAFALATMNVGGASATGVSLVVSVPSSITGLAYQVNQTNPITGAIIGPATGLNIAVGATPTFGVFLTPTKTITFDPSNNRITLKLVDGSGKLIGAQSVAVSTT